MAHQRDYYQVLQVSPKADTAIIKAAYYTQLKTMKKHPDLGGSHEEATLLNEAYEVLSDPIKRKEYDQKFFKGAMHPAPKPQPNPFTPEREKRRAVRLPFHQNFKWKRKVEDNWTGAQFRDISLLGACLRSLEPFKIGETLELDISEEPLLKGKAKVRWVRPIPQRFGKTLYEGGIEFQSVDASLLKSFIEQYRGP